MIKILIFCISLLLLGCQSDKEVNSDNSQDIQKQFNPTFYKGYAYTFFNEIDFQDGFYYITILPIGEEYQHYSNNSFITKLAQESFFIWLPIEYESFEMLNKNNEGTVIESNFNFCKEIINPYSKWTITYIEYVNYEEYFIKNCIAEKNEIDNEEYCKIRLIHHSDSSKLLQFKIAK